MVAQDAYQAVDQARKNHPDVMILDINMPAGDGFSVHNRLSKISSLQGVPIIYLTGDRSVRVASMAREREAFALSSMRPGSPPETKNVAAERALPSSYARTGRQLVHRDR